MANSPLVSVIIRTYNNRNNLLKEAIDSVINQTYKNIQVVVVEDGSTYSKELIEDFSKNSILTFKYASIEKSGRSVAGNKGLELADGRFINFLDDDDRLMKNHIELLLNSILKYKVKAAYSNAYEVTTEFLSLDPLNYIEHEKKVIYNLDFSRVLLWTQNYLPIQSVLFDRALYIRHGGFEVDMDALEDWNLWTRYSLYDDFKHIDLVTSIYRVPFYGKMSSNRILSIDDYKNQALEKQKRMIIETNVYDIVNMLEEINKKTLVFFLSKEHIRSVVLNNCILNKFYSKFRSAYYKLFFKG